ncbi:hypothetical protein EGW08_015520 [Elysia chlorotica]|uniref:EGF-like domain-containing protein n=1 Tax=Elysia chlorotica TaxID=188477 RepID=A0A433T597_ELYCH|nr:hypothetical protein EGW08_015520 [Elysia chlorotica]
MIHLAVALGIVLIAAIGERTGTSAATGRRKGGPILPHPQPSERRFQQTFYWSEKTPRVLLAGGHNSDHFSNEDGSQRIVLKGRSPKSELEFVETERLPQHQPAKGCVKKNAMQFGNNVGSRPAEVELPTQKSRFITVLNQGLKDSLPPADRTGGPSFQRKAMENSRDPSRSPRRPNRWQQKHIHTEETLFYDQDLPPWLLTPRFFLGLNKTLERGTTRSQHRKVGWGFVRSRQSVQNESYKRHQGRWKRAAQNSTVPCQGCAGLSTNYQQFHERNCTETLNGICPWCQCPNRARCHLPDSNCHANQCAYGWDGVACEISICPKFRFGQSSGCSLTCTETCHYNRDTCHPINGECLLFFKSATHAVCPRKTFGHACNHECHCWGDLLCHPTKGECLEGVCAKKYSGRTCNIAGTHYLKLKVVQHIYVLLFFISYFKLCLRLYKSKICTGIKKPK